MPLYDIEHVIPLTAEQQQALAKVFTDLHAKVRYTKHMESLAHGKAAILHTELFLKHSLQ